MKTSLTFIMQILISFDIIDKTTNIQGSISPKHYFISRIHNLATIVYNIKNLLLRKSFHLKHNNAQLSELTDIWFNFFVSLSLPESRFLLNKKALRKAKQKMGSYIDGIYAIDAQSATVS